MQAQKEKLINLDALIMDKEDRIPCLKISDDIAEESSRHRSGSDSDSSYGEAAKIAASNMDQMILEAEMRKKEKNRRIIMARAEKAKQSEAKQNPKSKHKKEIIEKVPVDSNSIVGSSKFKRNNKSGKNINKKPISNKPPESSDPRIDNKEVLPSKLRNVTIQDFDVGSDSEEDPNVEVKIENKQFKVKSLNRLQADVDDRSESCESADDGPPRGHFVSAQKSAAANRRKKSGYYNKRNYKASQNLVKRDTVQGAKAYNKLNSPSKTFSQDKPLDRPTNLQDFGDLKSVSRTKTSELITEDQYKQVQSKSEKGMKFKKGNVINLSNRLQPTEQQNACKRKDKGIKNKISALDSGFSFHADNNKKSVSRKQSSRSDVSIRNRITPVDNNSFTDDDSIVILSDIPLTKCDEKIDINFDGKDLYRFKFELSPASSDTEIDWKAIDNCHKSHQTTDAVVDSESDDDIDFDTILMDRKIKNTKPPQVVSIKTDRDLDGSSSSDFEAEFDACLVKFDQIK